MFAYTHVDYLVIGEGEITSTELLQHIHENEIAPTGIQGVAHRCSLIEMVLRLTTGVNPWISSRTTGSRHGKTLAIPSDKNEIIATLLDDLQASVCASVSIFTQRTKAGVYFSDIPQ
ncbi:MAG: hypothetical protein AB9872_14920 [Solidesulfovibrio sp.]